MGESTCGLGVGRLFLWRPPGLVWPLHPHTLSPQPLGGRNSVGTGDSRGAAEGMQAMGKWQRRIAEAHRLKDGPWPRHDTNRHHNRPASRNAVHD